MKTRFSIWLIIVLSLLSSHRLAHAVEASNSVLKDLDNVNSNLLNRRDYFLNQRSSNRSQKSFPKNCIPSPDGCTKPRSTRSNYIFVLRNLPYLLSPRNTYLLEENPVLRWFLVEGATEYRVQVKQGDGTLVWETTVNSSEIRYAGPTLEPGVHYIWAVVTDTGAFSLDEELYGAGGFIVLDAQKRAEIQTAADNRARGLTGIDRDLAIAEVYTENGALASTIALLEARIAAGDPTAALYQALGENYENIFLPPLAIQAYLKAVAIVPPEELAELAELQTRLGENYRRIQQPQVAIQWLEKAQTNYETLGEIGREGEVKKLIEQIRHGMQ